MCDLFWNDNDTLRVTDLHITDDFAFNVKNNDKLLVSSSVPNRERSYIYVSLFLSWLTDFFIPPVKKKRCK